MIDTTPELETRVEQALKDVFKDAFPDVTLSSWSEPVERGQKSIGIKAESEGEDPIGTNIFTVNIEIEARNLEHHEREIMRQMLGNARNAKITLSEYSNKRYAMPKGQPVDVLQAGRSAENEKDRLINYTLSASIQPY